MVKSKITLFICLFCAFAVSQAYSAPSVKKLGGVNSVAGIGGVASVKSDALNNVRSASVRAVKPLNNVKPVITTKANNSGGAAVDNVNTARLSVGKYLHNAGTNAGLIKPVTISNTAINNSGYEEYGNQVTNLTNRIEILENNSNINVVENDENADTTKMINGINVDDDGRTLRVSRSNVKIPVGSESASPTASIWVEE